MSQQQPSQQYLVISALGRDRPGIINQLTLPIGENGGNIIDSRMTILGGEFAVLMLVEGSWDTLAKLESMLPKLEDKLEMSLNAKRTEARGRSEGLPYGVNVVALDNPGIVSQLTGFFSARGINIQDLHTDSYRAAHTGTPMFSANMTLHIPATVQIAQLREEFLDFCDNLNLDAVLEPVKG